MSKLEFWKRCLLLLPLALIASVAIIAGYGALEVFGGSPTASQRAPGVAVRNPPAGGTSALEAQSSDLKNEADEVKSRTDELKNEADALKSKEDDLKWILGFILGAAALFAAGQAAGTWFSADTFTKRAQGTLDQLDRTSKEVDKAKEDLKDRSKDALGEFEKAKLELMSHSEEVQKAREALNTRLQETFSEFEKSLKLRYPIYAQMAEMWGDAFRNLTTILESTSPGQNPDESFYWGRGLYEKMPLQSRRELITAQQIAPYEIAGRNEPDKAYVTRLRRLARFYWSKFIYERQRGAAELSDLEQAEYLLEQAMHRIGRVFYLLNDKGNIYLEYYKAHLHALPAEPIESQRAALQRTLDRARQSFEDSILLQTDQLRAHFNLAYIEAEFGPADALDARLGRAIAQLKTGLKYPNWEKESVPEFTCKAFYNLGCYSARLPYSADTEAACRSALEEAAKIGLADPGDVDRDFHSPDGDFAGMLKAMSDEGRKALRKLENELSRNSQRSGGLAP
jgi:hypothetical protein